MKVLIIDDDFQICMLLAEILTNEGHEVWTAANGQLGLELHYQKNADLVITDIIMPEKEGLETIMAIRMHTPEVKIIAISGGGRIGPDNYLGLAKKMGVHATLAKPFTPGQLLQAIKQVIK